MLFFLCTAIIAFVLTPFIINIYTTKGWLDNPKNKPHVKKIHATPIPRGGGIGIFLAILIASSIFLQFDKYLIAIMVASFSIVLVGFFDDIFDLSPVLRLVTNFLASLIVIGTGIGIAYISNPLSQGVIHLDWPQITFFLFGAQRSIWILADVLALIFIVWNMNIINWSTGIPGQMPGLVAITSTFIGLLSSRFIDDPTQFNTMSFCFIIAGAYGGYLFWNWQPQKSMPGYGGSSLAGFLLAVMSIISGAKVATLLMSLAIPTADAIFTILRRIIAHKSPFLGDRGHLHHKLIDVLGWSQLQTAIFYWLASLGLGLLSLQLNTWQKLITMLIVFASVFGFLVWARIVTLKKRHDQTITA